MNVRALLHSLEVAAAAIAAGTVTIAGLGTTATTDVVAGAALFVLVVSTYLGSTTSGSSAAALASKPAVA